MREWIALSVAIAALSVASTRAAADDDEDYNSDGDGEGRFEEPYFAAKLMLTAAGEGESDGESIGPIPTPVVQDDLEPGYGVGFAYMHPLAGFLALGGQVSLISWTSETAADNDIDRNMYLDFSFVPQVNFDIPIVELYLNVPIGFTVDFIGDDTAFSGGAASVSVGAGTGYHIGLMLGARIALSKSFGLLGELGYVAHNFTHEVEGTSPLGTVTYDVDMSLGQGALNLGVYF